MSPYRMQPPSWTPSARRRREPLWPWIGPGLIGIAVAGIGVGEINPRFLVVNAALLLVGLAIVVVAHAKTTAMGRLCRLTWHRGDRFGATMLFLGVGVPQYSEKRLARNRAAIAVAVEQSRRERQLFR